MIKNKYILIIDDDLKLNQLLKEYLGKFEFNVEAYTIPSEGLKAIRRKTPDMIILDVMLPQMSGFDVCKEIRSFSKVPVIMLTARGEVTDRVVGLELGADDYLPKPFEPRELVARIQTVLRRSNDIKDGERLVFGPLVINIATQSAELDGRTLNLTTAEFDLLTVFAKSPGRVMDRDNIMEKLKGVTWEVFDRSIDVLMSRLRQKMNDDLKSPRFIKTVWGKGYMFVGMDMQKGEQEGKKEGEREDENA